VLGNDLSEMPFEALRMGKFPVKKDVDDARLIKLASQQDLHPYSQWGIQQKRMLHWPTETHISYDDSGTRVRRGNGRDCDSEQPSTNRPLLWGSESKT